MAWCCSDPHEAPEAFSGTAPVIDSLEPELEALLGRALLDRLRAALESPAETRSDGTDSGCGTR